MIKLATVGTSTITVALLNALEQTEGIEFVGAVSRDAQRAATFTAEHGGTHPFTSVKEAAACPEVDAVYIGSPNALHHSQALTAIAAGKHVLMEKPFCSNEREAREVFEAAETAGVVVLEAMRPLHDPAFHALSDVLPELGRIRRATLRFGKYSARYDEVLAGRQTNIFDCELSTGALMDIGVYTVEPLVALFGAPASLSASAALLDESTQGITHGAIDGAGVILASYPGMVASLHFAKNVNDLASSQFEGELGTLTVDAISTPGHATLELRQVSKGTDSVGFSTINTSARELVLPRSDNTMTYELADFVSACEAVREGCAPADAPAGTYGTVGQFRDITLSTMALMDEARRQMGVRFPADLA